MATLTVKVIEEITLNNNSYNSERSLDISSVNEIVKRIVTISTTETGLLGFDAGHSFIYPGDNSGGVIDTMHAGGSALTVSLNDLVDITAQADTSSVDLEVFVGSA
jgi:hypothetical protein